MSNQRQPIQLIQAKGNKHLTKSEIEERTNSEIAPITDGDALARYVVVEELFESASKTLQDPEVLADPEQVVSATLTLEKCFKMCRAAAGDLGLTITSRCKLVVPKPPEEKKQNKFSRFNKTG